MIVVLNVENSTVPCIVASTHLKAKDDFAHIRSGQITQLLEVRCLEHGGIAQLRTLIAYRSLHNKCLTKFLQCVTLQRLQALGQSDVFTGLSAVPVLLCGDFNGTPDEDIYRLCHESPMSLRSTFSKPVVDVCSAESLRRALETPSDAAHSAVINDALAALQSLSLDACRAGESAITTCKIRSGGEKARTIDYMWFGSVQRTAEPAGDATPKRAVMLPLAVGAPYTRKELGPNALPNDKWASDHLFLSAWFAYCDMPQ